MIRRIVIERFKSFERVDLSLGHFNLFIGPNASGKSNFLDALRVLQGIGYGLSIDEILNGKPKSAIGEAWEPIRGGAVFSGRYTSQHTATSMADFTVRFEAAVSSGTADPELRYELEFNPFSRWCKAESLLLGGNPVFAASFKPSSRKSTLAIIYKGNREPEAPSSGQASLRPEFPALTQLQGDNLLDAGFRSACAKLAAALADLQNLNPVPSLLRQYSTVASASRMGGNGEDFAAIVSHVAGSPDVRGLYLSWLQALTPDEIDDIHLFKGALEEPLFGITRLGMHFPAPVLSDGTLRFAAIAAAFFQPSMPSMMAFEEIENGVHPSRLRLVVELMRSLSKSPAPQVFATSHSPVILDWLTPEDYPFVFLCRRNPDTGASEIRTLASLLERFPRGSTKLSDLAVEGWFEAVP